MQIIMITLLLKIKNWYCIMYFYCMSVWTHLCHSALIATTNQAASLLYASNAHIWEPLYFSFMRASHFMSRFKPMAGASWFLTVALTLCFW